MKNNPYLNQQKKSSGVPMPPMPPSSGKISSDMFEVDLTNVQSNFIIPDDDYLVQLVDVEQGVSKADNPQFIWTFVIVDGDYAGMEMKVFTAITPAAMWKVAETVEALGIGSSGQAVRFSRKEVINRQCIATVEKQTYNDVERSQISKLRKIGE